MDVLSCSKIPLTNSDMRRIEDMVYCHCGIVLKGKRDLVRSRLGRWVLRMGFTSFKECLDHIERGSETARTSFIDQLTTNVTTFFRESHHFDFLRAKLPMIAAGKRARGDRSIRIWSAGCSTGEEPYSIVVLLLEFFGDDIRRWDVKVIGTDVSRASLDRAREGIYPERQTREMPGECQRYFQSGWTSLTSKSGLVSQGQKVLIAGDAVRRLAEFRYLNLMSVAIPFREPFDLIFCRNVMIYFDSSTQEALVNRFSRHLHKGGYLFIGHSESLSTMSHPYKWVAPSTYQLDQHE